MNNQRYVDRRLAEILAATEAEGQNLPAFIHRGDGPQQVISLEPPPLLPPGQKKRQHRAEYMAAVLDDSERDRRRAYMRDYQRKHRLTENGRRIFTRSNLKALHGITLEQYAKIYDCQRGCCAICDGPILKSFDPKKAPGKRGAAINQAHVDHDHGCCPGRGSCGKCIRGLLCTRCNQALSAMRDNPDLLLRAAAYLRRGYVDTA